MSVSPQSSPEPPTDEGISLGGRLAGRSLLGQVIFLAAWPLLEQILAFVVGLTDLLIAGRMGGEAQRVAVLDAMGLGVYVAWLMSILGGAISTGVMALVSRATGAREHGLANLALGQGVWLGAVAGLASMLVLLAGTGPLIRLMGLTGEAAAQAESYLRVLVLSAPLSGAMFSITAALRGSGDTLTPFLGMVVVNFVNVGLSVLFVFGPAPLGGHGVAGIAAGTVGGWALGLLATVLLLGRGRGEGLRWERASLHPHRDTMRRIIRVGFPQALEITGMWLIHAFSIRIISGLNSGGALGAHIIAIRAESMSFLPGFAIGTAAATLAGQYLGAGSRALAARAVKLCWVLATAMMGVMGVFFVLARHEIVGLMAPGSELHLRLAAPLLLVCGLSQPFFATCIVLKTAMRGTGATGLVMRWSFGSMFFFRVVVLWALLQAGWLDLTGVWLVMTADMITQAVVFTRLHFRGDWLDARV